MTRILLTLALLATITAPLQASKSAFVAGELLVLLESEHALQLESDGNIATTSPDVASVLSRHGLESFVQESRNTRLRPNSKNTVRLVKMRSSRADFDPISATRDLMATGAFRAVTPNYIAELHETTPNDQFLYNQWWVESNDDADIKLTEAWDVELGNASTIIALMDVGFDMTHPDLAGRAWVNPGEIPGNSIDDDNNGYVDDINGWDFGDDDNDPNPHEVLQVPMDTTSQDLAFHGSAMAGIAGAHTNNTIGMAGTTWGTQLMNLKFIDSADTNMVTTEYITNAFQYAIDNGADVLSMSFGLTGPGIDEFMQALVDDGNAAGLICVTSAGNDDSDTLSAPANANPMIVVGATNSLNQRASFSSWGPLVDVAAPGQSVYSCIQTNYRIKFWPTLYYQLFNAYDLINPYMRIDGTSASTPMVAGVCAMIRSKWPSLTPEQVEAHLVATGDAIAFDKPIGVKVNAYNAVTMDLVAAGDPTRSVLRFEGVSPNPFVSATSIRFALPQAGEVNLVVYNVAGRKVRRLVSGEVAAGVHAVNWDGRAEDGSPLTSGMYFARLEASGGVITESLVLLR